MYGCFQKEGYRKMDGLSWKTLLKFMIWGYHYFWKHPYIHIAMPNKYMGVQKVHSPYISNLSCCFNYPWHKGQFLCLKYCYFYAIEMFLKHVFLLVVVVFMQKARLWGNSWWPSPFDSVVWTYELYNAFKPRHLRPDLLFLITFLEAIIQEKTS